MQQATESAFDPLSRLLPAAFAPYRHLYTPGAWVATTEVDWPTRLREGPTWVANDVQATVGAEVRDGVYIRTMAVHPDAQGQGLGWQLLSTAEAWAIEQGAPRMYLSTTPFLAPSRRLYERFGFVQTAAPPHELHGTPLVSYEKLLPARAKISP